MKKLLVLLTSLSMVSTSSIDLHILENVHIINDIKATDINDIIKETDLGTINISGTKPTSKEISTEVKKKNPLFDEKKVTFSDITDTSTKITGDGKNVTGSIIVYYDIFINAIDLQNMDLSNFAIKHSWGGDHIQINDINIQTTSSTSTDDYLTPILKGLDKKYYNEERPLIPKGRSGQGSIFIDYLNILTLNTDFKLNIQNATSSSPTSFKTTIFDNMTVPENNVYSYNLEFVNLHNNSSFVFSVNICNLDTKHPITLADSSDPNYSDNNKHLSSINKNISYSGTWIAPTKYDNVVLPIFYGMDGIKNIPSGWNPGEFDINCFSPQIIGIPAINFFISSITIAGNVVEDKSSGKSQFHIDKNFSFTTTPGIPGLAYQKDGSIKTPDVLSEYTKGSTWNKIKQIDGTYDGMGFYASHASIVAYPLIFTQYYQAGTMIYQPDSITFSVGFSSWINGKLYDNYNINVSGKISKIMYNINENIFDNNPIENN